MVSKHNLLYISCVAISATLLNGCTITLLWSMHASHFVCNTNTAMGSKILDFVSQIAMRYQVNYALCVQAMFLFVIRFYCQLCFHSLCLKIDLYGFLLKFACALTNEMLILFIILFCVSS